MDIKLGHGFFVEVDEWQYILKRRYTATRVDGSKREEVKTISYHRTLEQVCEKYIHMVQELLQADKTATLREYVNLVKRSNKEAVKAVERLVHESEGV